MANFTFNFKQASKILAITLMAICFFLFSAKTFAAQGINHQINFQGKVVKSDGTNVADGDYDFIFKIYSAASGGSPIWTETRTGGSQVHVAGGIFRVSLGSVASLPGSVDFNSDSLYLGIEFNSDGEMTPRVRFSSVPYAFNAEKVNGLTVQNTSGNPFSSTTTLQIADGQTVVFNNGLTFSGTNGTTFTFPSGSGNVVTEDSNSTLTNKTIGSTGLSFSGASIDLSTVNNEDLTLTPNGSGNIILTSTYQSGVRIGSSSNTAAPLSVSGGIGSNAAFILNQANSGDIFAASSSGTTKFRIAVDGSLVGANSAWTILATGSARMTSWEGGGLADDCSATASKLLWNSLTKQFACGTDIGAGTQNIQSSSGSGPTTLSSASETSISSTTITPSSSSDKIWVVGSATVRGDATQNRTVTLRLRQGASCAAGAQVGVDMVVQTDYASDAYSSVVSFLDTPGTTNATTYQLCAIADAGSPTVEGRSITAYEPSPSIFQAQSTSNWDLNTASGTLNPKQTTADLLIGGTSTQSAKFTILNMAGGTPVASIAGTLSLGGGSGVTRTIGATAKNNLQIGDSNTGGLILAPGGNITFFARSNGDIGIGSNNFTPQATLDIRPNFFNNGGTSPILFLSGQTSKASLVVDNSGVGELFTASASGTPKFTINASGAIGLGYTAGTPNYGNASQCLSSNGSGSLPSWGTCGGNSSPLQVMSGVMVPFNSTEDLLIGGQSTASAKFAVLNVNNGTPTASISAGTGTSGGSYITAGGLHATTNREPLTLGDSNTGSIVLTTGFDKWVNIGGASQTPAVLSVSGGIANNAAFLVNNNNSGDIITASASGATKFRVLTDGTASSAAGFTINAAGNLQTTNGQTLTLGGSATGNIVIDSGSSSIMLSDNTSISGALSGLTGLTLASGAITLGGSTGAGQCLVGGASAAWGSCGGSTGFQSPFRESGGTIIPLNSTEDLMIGGQSSASAKFTFVASTGELKLSNVSGNSGQCLTSAGSGSAAVWGSCITGSGNVNWWNLTSSKGTIAPINQTLDFLLGSVNNATDEARLAITGINNSNSPTIQTKGSLIIKMNGAGIANNAALIVNNTNNGDLFAASASGTTKFIIKSDGSASTSGNFTLDGTGSLTTTKKQNLKIGDASTGNILIGSGTSQEIVFNDQTGTPTMAASGAFQIGSIGGTTNAGGRIWVRSGSTNYRFTSTSNAVDYSEYLQQEETSEPGDVMVLGTTSQKVRRSSASYQQNIVGVVSEYGTGYGRAPCWEEETCDRSQDPSWANVGMLGQIYTKVSNENGEVTPGDPLTASSIVGVAMKATKAGRTIGHAIDFFDGSTSGQDLFNYPTYPVHPDTTPSGQPVTVGKIMALVEPGWYDPSSPAPDDIGSVIIINNGLSASSPGGQDYGLTTEDGRSWDNVTVADQAAFGNIKVGGLTFDKGHANELNTNLITAQSMNVQEGLTVSGTIRADKIIARSFEVTSDDLQKIITNGGMLVASKIQSDEAILDSLKSKTIATDSFNAGSATVSGVLTVDTIRARKIEGLAFDAINYAIINDPQSLSYINSFDQKISSISARLDAIENLSNVKLISGSLDDNYASTQNFMVFGTTTLNELSVLDSISIGSSLKISASSIDSMGQDLEFQPLGQGNISFFGGRVKFDTAGNIETQGNISVAGILSAQTGRFDDVSITRSQIKIISDTEATATGSSGLARIKAKYSDIKIKDPKVSESSIIFISPKVQPGIPLYLKGQGDGEFIVGVDREATQDAEFNFLIIN